MSHQPSDPLHHKHSMQRIYAEQHSEDSPMPCLHWMASAPRIAFARLLLISHMMLTSADMGCIWQPSEGPQAQVCQSRQVASRDT